MKILAVLLSLATLILSSYPCCQETDSCSETFAVHQKGNNDPEGIPHKKESPCSPFYTCGRCPGFTISYESIEILLLDFEPPTLIIPYIEHQPKEVWFHSLKPPRFL